MVTAVKAPATTLTIYIFMDDSGKLSENEKVSVFAGIAFINKKEKEKFNRQYKKIIEEIRCSYCSEQKDMCNNNRCPEIKNFNIKSKHKRRIINLCKQQHTYAVIIDNTRIYKSILNSKASKGRYTDYAQKMIIKKIIQDLINNGTIDPDNDLNLLIQIDQQSTKSNGYYSLQESIDEELSKGIINFNYRVVHKPIIHGNLRVEVKYMDSKKVYGIQASDIIAGSVRKTVLISNNNSEINQKLNSFLKSKIMLP